jgi:hypothetical protein
VGAAAARDTRSVKAQDAHNVKRDLALYTMIRFHAASILQALDPAILSVDLITDDRAGDICSVTVPHASYPIRLFGAVVARHLWVRLTEGRWRCQRYQILEQYLDNARQWNDEDWWFERRICTWPAPLEAAGRDLLRKGERFVRSPPWGRCRECIRAAEESSPAAFSVGLPLYWRCRFTQRDAGYFPRAMMSAIPPAEWPGDWRPHSTGWPRLVIAQKCRQAPVAGERHRVLQGNALPASFGGKTRAQGVSAEVPVDADELGPALDDEPEGLPAERAAVAALVSPPENGPRGQPRGGEPGGERRGGGAPTTGFTASALAPVPAGSVFECPRR